MPKTVVYQLILSSLDVDWDHMRFSNGTTTTTRTKSLLIQTSVTQFKLLCVCVCVCKPPHSRMTAASHFINGDMHTMDHINHYMNTVHIFSSDTQTFH